MAVLRGNLAPDGGVIKHIGGRAAGCCSTPARRSCSRTTTTCDARIDDPDLDVTPDSRAGAAERRPARRARACRSGACCRSRRSCSQQGVRDMVRISDARMSGTALRHLRAARRAESAVGGPLALVRDGDMIELDVPGARLDAARDRDEELAAPPRGWQPPTAATARLRRAVRRARDAGRPGLRLRLPGRGTGADPGAGDPLTLGRAVGGGRWAVRRAR